MPEICNDRKLMSSFFVWSFCLFCLFRPVPISLFVNYYDNHTFKSVVL